MSYGQYLRLTFISTYDTNPQQQFNGESNQIAMKVYIQTNTPKNALDHATDSLRHDRVYNPAVA